MVTPSVARLTWAYLEGLKLKLSDVDYSFIGITKKITLYFPRRLQIIIHLVFLPLVVSISLIHPREL